MYSAFLVVVFRSQRTAHENQTDLETCCRVERATITASPVLFLTVFLPSNRQRCSQVTVAAAAFGLSFFLSSCYGARKPRKKESLSFGHLCEPSCGPALESLKAEWLYLQLRTSLPYLNLSLSWRRRARWFTTSIALPLHLQHA